MKKNLALSAMMLPQYQGSETFMERFLEAVQEENAAILRNKRTCGNQLVDGHELHADALLYFCDNKSQMEAEFVAALSEKIGKERVDLFVNTIRSDWYCKRKTSGRVTGLKRSVFEYLTILAGSDGETPRFVQVFSDPPEPALLTAQEIAAILTVNDQMIHKHVGDWGVRRPNTNFIGESDVYLRRGLRPPSPLTLSYKYIEFDYINSYSLAISVPEKFTQKHVRFAQKLDGKVGAIVNGELGLFWNHFLFFSPFIPKMPIDQLEVGVIPRLKAQVLVPQGVHSDIHEYVLDPIDSDICAS